MDGSYKKEAMKMKRLMIFMAISLSLVGCASLTPEEKAQQQAKATACAQQGMLVADEGGGAYRCDPKPDDITRQSWIALEAACLEGGGDPNTQMLGGEFGTESVRKYYGCGTRVDWAERLAQYEEKEVQNKPTQTHCRTNVYGSNGQYANTNCTHR